MAAWYFVDLGEFVEKVSPIFEKLSIFREEQSSSHFKLMDPREGGDFIFFNGNEDISYLEDLLGYCRDTDYVFLITDNKNLSSEHEGNLNRFLLQKSSVRGVIESNQGFGFLISHFNGLKEMADLRFELSTDEEYIDDFEQQLNDLSKHLSAQLSRIKEIHRNVVPERSLVHKDFTLKCKFASGEQKHSEFWDAIKTERHLVNVILSTKNSSELTKVLTDVIDFTNIVEYKKENLKELLNKVESVLEGFSLFVMVTDVYSKKTYLIVHGNFLVYLNGREVIASRDGKINKISFQEGDKFTVFSEGLIKNYDEEYRLEELETIGKRNQGKSSRDFFNQVFFNSKINNEGRFHVNDCTALILEVGVDSPESVKGSSGEPK